MNRTLQVQLVFVAISLLVLVLVAFFPPSLRVAEVQFEQASREADRAARAEARKQRQREAEAGHSPGGVSDSGGGDAAPSSSGDTPGTVDPREAGASAPAASDPTPPALAGGRVRKATPTRTSTPRPASDLPSDAGEPANETVF